MHILKIFFFYAFTYLFKRLKGFKNFSQYVMQIDASLRIRQSVLNSENIYGF